MKKLYCMYDTVIMEATAPIVAKTDAEALRAFQKATQTMEYGQDKKLFYLAEWDEDAPAIHAVNLPREITPNVTNTKD